MLFQFNFLGPCGQFRTCASMFAVGTSCIGWQNLFWNTGFLPLSFLLSVFCLHVKTKSIVNGKRVLGLLKSLITVQSGALVDKWIANALFQEWFIVFEIWVELILRAEYLFELDHKVFPVKARFCPQYQGVPCNLWLLWKVTATDHSAGDTIVSWSLFLYLESKVLDKEYLEIVNLSLIGYSEKGEGRRQTCCHFE